MARAIWKGSISFGLVNIPVGLYSAESRDEIHFKMLDRKTLSPIHYKRMAEEGGKEVAWEETVRGYELEKGHYVVLSDEDLKRASPEATQTIDILSFVDLEDISPLYFDKPYYLAPDSKGTKAYTLLRETLRRTGKVGIAKVVIRTRQYLAAVVARGEVITLEILRYAHELRDADELDLPSGKEGVTPRELQMAERLVEGMVEAWKPEKYKDDYREDLMKLIEERAKAGELEGSDEPVPKAKPARGQVLDLMALLKESLEGGKKGGKAPARKPAAKRPPAQSAAAKKPARKAAKKPAAARKRKSA
jgi:DNA end-binding protein Ku